MSNDENYGSVFFPIILDNKPIRVKRKYGKYPAIYTECGIIDMFNKEVNLRNLILRRRKNE